MFVAIRSFLFCTLLAFPGAVFAQSKIDYYRSLIPVKTQLRDERLTSYQDALMQVLFRMSGSESVFENEQLLQKAKTAHRYIQQFQYVELDSEELRQEGYRESLSVTFSPVFVKKMLTEAGPQFWSEENRPGILVWLVEDNPEFGRQLLNSQSEAPILDALIDAAGKRGLPLSFPLLDLEDQLALSAEDVWNVDEEAIKKASERYSPGVILVGRYSQTSRGGLWSIWQYYHSGESGSYDSRVNIEDEGAEEQLGIDALYPLADFLADRYAIQPQLGAGARLVVEVKGVNDFSDYRSSLSYLEGLAAVSSVHIASVQKSSILLYLESEASIDKLLSVIKLDKKLYHAPISRVDEPVWQQAPRGTIENPLLFEWSS